MGTLIVFGELASVEFFVWPVFVAPLRSARITTIS